MDAEAALERKRDGIEGELEQFHPASFGWALACCAWNRQEAEEVLQTSYLKALDGRARFNGFSSARTWFFAVVKRTAAERRRGYALRQLAQGRWRRVAPAVPRVPTPEELSRGAEEQRRLQACLLQLSVRQRELLHLVFYQELTIEEAAHVVGISLGSARTHYARGKAQLRFLLSEERQR